MKIVAITLLFILVLGFLFVQWANKPENVEALKKRREMEAIQKVEDAEKQVLIRKEQALVRKEIEAKKATMKLAIDENFANNRFERLTFKYSTISYFKFEKNEFDFSGMVTKGQNAQDYFIISKDDFGDLWQKLSLESGVEMPMQEFSGMPGITAT